MKVGLNGWVGTLLCVVLSLVKERQSTKLSVVGHSSCPIANDARQTARCRAACCRDVTLSLSFAYEPSDRATSRQRAVWRARERRQCDNARDKTRRKGDNDKGCVVAIDNATRKVYQISHHRMSCRFNLRYIKFECWMEWACLTIGKRPRLRPIVTDKIQFRYWTGGPDDEISFPFNKTKIFIFMMTSAAEQPPEPKLLRFFRIAAI
jgi:hypothetical protein